ncbi:MAG: hypothetical protein ABIS07_16675 [Dokdonella sp.]
MNRAINAGIRRCAVLSALSLGGIGSVETATAATGPGPLPSGYSLTRTGGREDFDFMAGAWTTSQRKLKARGVGSTEWKDGPSNTHCATHYLDGAVTVDESYSPTKTVGGLFVYAFDVGKHQWSLYWIDSKVGKLDAPLVGGFERERGEFYGEDIEDGHAIKVRYSWIKQDHDHARWEQAYSYDNQSWETNWTSDFTRADPASTCVKNGQSKVVQP